MNNTPTAAKSLKWLASIIQVLAIDGRPHRQDERPNQRSWQVPWAGKQTGKAASTTISYPSSLPGSGQETTQIEHVA